VACPGITPRLAEKIELFVPVKTAEQQATALLPRGREQLVRQRMMLVNALRAHLAEFGIVAAQGLRHVGELIAIVRDDGETRLPDVARQVLQVLANQIEQIEAAITALERQLLAWHKANPVSQRLASIPGIGPIIAAAIATTVPTRMCSARAESSAAAARRRGAGEQNGAHRLGGDAAREGIPAQGYGRLVAHGTGAGACERAMTRNGTVGRSDATERSLPFHWDIDPARVMRPRFADSIRASSHSGLREQAGDMTASDLCAARQMISCQAGVIHT